MLISGNKGHSGMRIQPVKAKAAIGEFAEFQQPLGLLRVSACLFRWHALTIPRAVFGSSSQQPMLITDGLLSQGSSHLQESGRLVMTRLLVNAFRTVLALTPQDLLPVVYLCTGQIAPSHEGIELGIGDAILIKVCLWISCISMRFSCCWGHHFCPITASLE